MSQPGHRAQARQSRTFRQFSRPYLALGLLISTLMVVSSVFNTGASRTDASSHREAPLISADPQADNTDLYAFVSPDEPDTVTLMITEEPSQKTVAVFLIDANSGAELASLDKIENTISM